MRFTSQTAVPVVPSFEEVKAFFLEHNESLDFLDKCFYYYSDANWTNRDGKKVKDWKRTIKTNWFGKNNNKPTTFIPAESRPIRVHESYQTNEFTIKAYKSILFILF